MIVRFENEFDAPLLAQATRFMTQHEEAGQHGMRRMSGMGHPQSKTGAAVRSRPLVGFPGLQNSLKVEHRSDGIYCRVSTGAYIFVLAGTAIFGPAVLYLLYFMPEKLEPHTPRLILGAVWFLSVLSSAVFVRYALGCPRFKAIYSTGEILYFAWWGSTPSLVLRRGEVQTIAVEERPFLNEGTRVPNYYITVLTYGDKRYALCVSTDQQMVLALKSDLENAVVGRV
jgi:hypothetical protein